ncbi:uncharacterized protein [Haliotis asinina]|uniref:uncharacterized protein n=1 Tax=Haliotis asinina TaxID=109174 RepID=UPI003531FE13
MKYQNISLDVSIWERKFTAKPQTFKNLEKMGNCLSTNGRPFETDPSPKKQGRQPERINTNQVKLCSANIKVLKRAVDILERHNHVAITGVAGDGKTSIATTICDQNSKYEPLFVQHIEDFDVKIITNRRCHMLVIFDDIFNGLRFSSKLEEIFKVLADSLIHDDPKKTPKDSKRKSTSKRENPRSPFKLWFIFTSRKYNWNRGCSIFHRYKFSLFRPETIVDMTKEYWTAEEKKRLLRLWVAKYPNFELCDNDIQNIAHSKNIGFGFPLACSLVFPNPEFQMHPVDFFQNPVTFLRCDLDPIIREDSNRSAAIILLILRGGNLNLVTFLSGADFEKLFRVVKGVVECCTRTGIGDEIRNFNGTFCIIEDDIAYISHPSVYDAAACALSHLNLVLLLQYCSLKFLNERVRLKKTLQTSTTDDVTNMIYISPALYKSVVDRLAEGIRQRCFKWTVTHPALSNDTIASSLVAQLGGDLTRIAQQTDKTFGKCFLNWASLSKCYALFEGALSTLDEKRIKETESDIYESAALCVENHKFKHVVDIVTQLKLQDSFNADYKLNNGKTLFLVAAEVGAVDEFKFIMNEDADLTWTDPDGLTSFHYACKSGSKDIVEILCEKTPHIINVRDNHGVTSALIASEMGHDKILQLLKSKGADVTLCDNQNRNCLHVASCAGRLSTVTYLLGLECLNINCLGGKFSRTPVMMAVLNGHYEVYRSLVCQDADLSLCDTNNNDCLMLASEGGNKSIVENLLSMHTFDINRKRKWDDQTAVMLAAKGGHFDVYNLLVAQEADLFTSDLFDTDCLVWACIGGNVKIVHDMLSMERFDINKTYRMTLTPIMHAAYCGHYDVFNLLVENGADLSLKDDEGQDCLTWACKGGNASIVKDLLHLKRFDVHRMDSLLQQTLLMMAQSGGHHEVFDLLESRGARLPPSDACNNHSL